LREGKKVPYMTADDGVPIYYTDQGEGDPIFLIHGWTMNHKFFQHNTLELSRTHRIVTMDIRGHGRSGKQELNMSLRQAAEDARAVIDHLSLDRVTLAGWSMGTSLIFHYFDLFGGEKLKGAVFIDMTPRLVNDGGWEHGVFGTLDYAAAYALERDIFEDRMTVEAAFIPACFKDGVAPDEETIDWWIGESMLTPTGVMAAFWTSMVAYDWREQLPKTPVPVLLCYGARSALYPTEIGALLDEEIPQSELVVFEESGHSPFWEEPEKFNREVTRFAG
jgi:pimeloyl-ACP methyl ester carboxylesterase